MSAAADDMESALMERAKGYTEPGDDMEAALMAQAQSTPKTPAQKSQETQTRLRSVGGDTAGFGAGEYVADWAKQGVTAGKNYLETKGKQPYAQHSAFSWLDDLAKAAGTGIYNNTVAPLFGVGAGLGAKMAGNKSDFSSLYMQGKRAAMINPSPETAAAGDVIGAATKPLTDAITAPGEIAAAAEKTAGASPDTQQMTRDLTNIVTPFALSKVSKLSPAKEISKESAQSVLNKEASAQSIGSAGAAIDLSKQSPEFVADLQRRVDKGESLNPKAVAAQALGDRLPVKMTFTKGQALEDPALLSEELNKRRVNPEISVKRLNEQNQQLIDNLNSVREKYGENDFSSNHIERGQKLMESYAEYDKSKQADINAKYKALEDAAQGANPIDAVEIYNQTAKNLQAKLKLTRAQQLPEFNELKQLAEKGEMTFDNYHTLMQDLGSVIARGGDEASAAKIIRDSMENMPLKPEAEGLRALRNEATKAAKERFNELDSDKAYSDVVNGNIQPDHFIEKYITGNTKTANKAQIDAIKQKFGDDPAINDAINTAVIDRLRKEAGIDEGGKGNFSQARYNKYLQTISPKIKTAVAPDVLESLSDIGEAARLAKQLPAGNYVNTSNTATTLVANAAKNAEGVIPGAKIVSKVIEKYDERKANQELKKSFEYGAGMSEKKKMSEILNPKPKKDTKKK